jgi:pilus assembly protein Flp/PilA
MCNVIWKFAATRQGVTAIEYGLIAALIAMAVVAALGILGTDLTEVFTTVANSL